MKIITDPHCTEYLAVGHPETPQRVSKTAELLRDQDALPLSWGQPVPVEDAQLLRAHDSELFCRLEQPGDFDADTPAFPNVAAFARRSVGGALAALDCAMQGDIGFSLMRPPGHHATRNRAMGFCYLNSIAVAAFEARARGFQRVAVLDFDVHHGNGTEDILVDQPGLAFASVHETGYPFTGQTDRGNNCFNFAAAQNTPREDYLGLLRKALERLKQFRPDIVAFSAGFDAYREDPLSDQFLEIEDYHWLGNAIRDFQVPIFGILEGGYSDKVPQLTLSFLRGLSNR